MDLGKSQQLEQHGHDDHDRHLRWQRQLDPDGDTRRNHSTTFNPNGEVTRSVDALGGVTTILYNADGKAIQTTAPNGMVTDTVYNGQGLVIYTDDPHKPGEPCDGTHTIYDQAGDVIGTERLANVVITVSTASGISSSVLTSVGQVLSMSTQDLQRRRPGRTDGRSIGHDHQQHLRQRRRSDRDQAIVNGVTRTTNLHVRRRR